MNLDITTFRLPDDQYYKEEAEKVQVYLHHTVGGSAESTFSFWQQTPEHVGTAYLVERDGTVFEVFDPKYWAYHLGLKIIGNTKYNKQSIGIEICSEGALRSGKELNDLLQANGLARRFNEEYLYAFDVDPTSVGAITWFLHAKKLYNIIQDKDKYYDAGQKWRDYQYFDAYDQKQLYAVCELAYVLCKDFNIPKKLIDGDRNRFDISLVDWQGILCHANVRNDKTDTHPGMNWDLLSSFLV